MAVANELDELEEANVDLLDSLLGLEDRFYADGHTHGLRDGARAGAVEGAVFGVQTGFDKFRQLGRLYGKAIIWAQRLPGDHGLLLPPAAEGGAATEREQPEAEVAAEAPESRAEEKEKNGKHIYEADTERRTGDSVENQSVADATALLVQHKPFLLSSRDGARLYRHVATLLALTDPATLPTANTESDVEAFDERLERAVARCRLIEKALGERPERLEDGQTRPVRDTAAENIEDMRPLPPREAEVELQF